MSTVEPAARYQRLSVPLRGAGVEPHNRRRARHSTGDQIRHHFYYN